MLGMGWGAGTILNALGTGVGCAFGISLKTVCRLRHSGSGNRMEMGREKELIDDIKSFFPVVKDPEFNIESSIPPGSGLGSSSAFVNSILTCLYRTSGGIQPDDIPGINSELSKKHGISYTGAYDDACASFYGGLVLTDNRKNEIILRKDLYRDCAVLIPPARKKKVDMSLLRGSEVLKEAVMEIEDGNIGQAMNINSEFYCERLGYSYEPVKMALRYVDEVGLSGNGPAYICLGEGEDIARVIRLWRRFGVVIRCRTVNVDVLSFIDGEKDNLQ